MRRTCSMIRMTGAACLPALVVGSMLMASGRPAQAQLGNNNAGDAPAVNRTNAIAGPDANRASAVDQESRMLIAHGLEMTIEGSTLQGLVQRSVGVGLGPAADPRPSTAGVVGSSSVATPAVAGPAASRTAVPPSTAGTGFTGSPGETVSGRPVGNGSDITPKTPVAGLADAPQPGVVGVSAAPTPSVPLTAGQSASMLQRHAMMSFEAGERLLNQGMGNGSDQKFQQAATRYANSLRAIASQPVLRVSPLPAGGTTVRTPIANVTIESTPTMTRSATTVGADPASVALINHGVKEAIGAMKIRQMVRQMGGTSGPSGQQLMEHAQMMESESRATVRAFAGLGDAGTVARPSGELGSPNSTVQALAQQADELIGALLGTGTDAGAPGR